MARIFVLGSINTDLVISTTKQPKSGETVKGTNFFTNGGGKGANQAVACAKMGAEVYFLGAVGDDFYGRARINDLKKYGVRTSQIQNIKGVKTGVALITLCDGENRIITSSEANALINFAKISQFINKKASSGDIMILQQEIPLEIVEKAIVLAKQKYMRVILNPAPAAKISEKLYKKIDLIVPNETETETILGINPSSDENAKVAVQKFLDMGIKYAVITLGSRGAMVGTDKEIQHIPARKVDVVDTTGAGDTFVGTIAVMLLEGKSLFKAAEYANIAASITVNKKNK